MRNPFYEDRRVIDMAVKMASRLRHVGKPLRIDMLKAMDDAVGGVTLPVIGKSEFEESPTDELLAKTLGPLKKRQDRLGAFLAALSDAFTYDDVVDDFGLCCLAEEGIDDHGAPIYFLFPVPADGEFESF